MTEQKFFAKEISKKEEAWLNILMTEWNYFMERIKQYEHAYRKDIQIAAVGIGGLFALLSLDTPLIKPEIIYSILPSSIFIFSVAQLNSRRIMFANWKKALRIEDKLKQKFNEQILSGHERIKSIYSGFSPAKIAKWTIIPLVLIVFVGFSIKAYSIKHFPLSYLLSGLHLSEMTIMILLLITQLKFEKLT